MSVDLQCCFSVGGIRSEFSNYGYVSVDIRKKRKVWFKYRDMYCSCTDPERFVRGSPTLTKVF